MLCHVDHVHANAWAGLPRTEDRQLPKLISATTPILRIVIIGAFVVGLALGVLGVVFVYLGAAGDTELRFFGQNFTSTNVGIAAVFLGSAMIVLVVRRALKSLDAGVDAESRSAGPTRKTENEESRYGSAVRSLRLRDMEASAFQLGRLAYLLLILEQGHKQEKISEGELAKTREKTLGYLTEISEGKQAPTLESAGAQDVMRAAGQIMRTRHTGRVENAFSLAALMQVLVLSRGDVTAYETQLKVLARDRGRIWTEKATLLPEDDAVRRAAKQLYDFAGRGEAPPGNDLKEAERILCEYYDAGCHSS